MRHALLIAILLFATVASAQETFDSRHAAYVAKNPTYLSLSIRLADGRTDFHPGERIPVEMLFTAADAGKYEVTTEPVLMSNYWIVAPEDGVTDPRADCGWGGVYSGPAGVERLDRPVTVTRDPNEQLRFVKPGAYRLYVICYAVRDALRLVSRTARPNIKQYPLTSNVITLRILPTDPAWTANTIARARASLRSGTEEEKLQAARALRFLGNEDAVREMVAAVGNGESKVDNEIFAGIRESPFRKLGISLLERRLADAQQPVSNYYVERLAHLAECDANPLPSMPEPLPGDEQGMQKFQAKLKEWRSVKRGPSYTELSEHYSDLLASSLSAKQGNARAIAVFTLLRRATSLSLTNPPPAWLPSVRAALPAVLPQLPAYEQSSLLEYDWQAIASPALLPVLMQIYNEPGPPKADPPPAVIALRRIYQLSPQEGRKLILSEIENPRFGAQADGVLLSLPDATLPQYDDLFVGWLKPRPDTPPAFDYANPRATKLLARYGTSATLPAVKAIFEAAPERFGCDAGIVAYFLRNERPLGETVAHRMLRDRPFSGPGHCAWFFNDLAKLAPAEAVESVAIGELGNPRVPARIQAATVLSRVGSPAAEKPLWSAFEDWRKWWTGREGDVNEENWQLENAFCEALSQARGWVLTPEKAQRMERLCISSACKGVALTVPRLFAEPSLIYPMLFPERGIVFSVQTYSKMDIAALKDKLKQFPKGTSFELRPTASPELLAVYTGLLSFARQEGIHIEVVPPHP